MKSFLTLSFILLSLHSFSQNRNKQGRIIDDCEVIANTNAKDRLKNYPFNKAVEVRLVSFKSDPLSDTPKLPEKNGKVDLEGIHEQVVLSKAGIDSLTQIIYNLGFKKNGVGEIMMCYLPRNAILFMNAKGEVSDFIEICFECRRTRTSSDKVTIGEACSEKFLILQSFFREKGIKYVED